MLEADIEHVREFRGRPSPAGVTDRQRAALETAVDALDCAPSTAGELLRKAEAAVVTDVVDDR